MPVIKFNTLRFVIIYRLFNSNIEKKGATMDSSRLIRSHVTKASLLFLTALKYYLVLSDKEGMPKVWWRVGGKGL